jgi:hypothetical protein
MENFPPFVQDKRYDIGNGRRNGKRRCFEKLRIQQNTALDFIKKN